MPSHLAALTERALRACETTRDLMARRAALSAQLRRTLLHCRHTRRQSPRFIRGGAQPGREDLRRRIRTWLTEGRLPMPGAEMWAGVGSGRECAICSAPITRYHVEYEVPNGDRWFSVHLGCFTLWKSEAAALVRETRADGRAAPGDERPPRTGAAATDGPVPG